MNNSEDNSQPDHSDSLKALLNISKDAQERGNNELAAEALYGVLDALTDMLPKYNDGMLDLPSVVLQRGSATDVATSGWCAPTAEAAGIPELDGHKIYSDPSQDDESKGDLS